jgi:hypothetical protein
MEPLHLARMKKKRCDNAVEAMACLLASGAEAFGRFVRASSGKGAFFILGRTERGRLGDAGKSSGAAAAKTLRGLRVRPQALAQGGKTENWVAFMRWRFFLTAHAGIRIRGAAGAIALPRLQAVFAATLFRVPTVYCARRAGRACCSPISCEHVNTEGAGWRAAAGQGVALLAAKTARPRLGGQNASPLPARTLPTGGRHTAGRLARFIWHFVYGAHRLLNSILLRLLRS